MSVLEIESPHPHHVSRFDGEREHKASFPDLEFVVQGLDRPLMLHRFVLAPASGLVHIDRPHHNERDEREGADQVRGRVFALHGDAFVQST